MPPADASSLRHTSAHGVPQPDICSNATDAPMNHLTQPSLSVGNSIQSLFPVGHFTQISPSVGNFTQPSLPVGNSTQPFPSVGNLGRDRKRKAEDDDDDPEERRVRSASALAGGSGDDGFVPPSARMSERCVESGLAWETESEVVMGDGFSSSPEDVGEILHCTGYGGSLEQERGSFAQEDERQRGALNGSQAFDSSLPSEANGAPSRHNGYQALPGAGHAKRKRGDGDDLEEGETGESSKRIDSKATDAPSPMLQRELGPAVVVFSHTGPHLGQLLPCGEIIGFLEFSPLAQHYDLCYLASIKPKAEHAGVYYTWQQIHKSAGIKSPSDQDCWFEKIITSGVESKDITFRAIKTFRELGEKIWQVPSAQSFTETLNLLLKEMDYTVLLLLGHCHQDDQGIWSNRLQVLFERLDPALWPKNQLASSANASAPNAEEFHAETQSWQLPSDLAAEMQESQEPATFSNAWSNPTPCSTPEPVDEGIYAVSEGLMDLRF